MGRIPKRKKAEASPRKGVTPAAVGVTFSSVTTGVVGAYMTSGSVVVTCVAGGLGLAVVVVVVFLAVMVG